MIKNKKELVGTEARAQLLDMIEGGIAAVNPRKLLRNAIRYNKAINSLTVLNNAYDIISGRIFVVGGGKAAGHMAEELENILGAESITDGVVTCRSDKYKTEVIKIVKASHPIPDKKGIKATAEMLALKEKYDINEKDLVICLISGGASAMVTDFVDGVSLKDSQELTRLLLDSNADIREINAVRKHISDIKGGKLGLHFAPAKVVSLIISDVVGDDTSVIGSGLTAIDSFVFRDVRDILKNHKLYNKIPESIHAHLEAGCNNERKETAKRLDNCDNYIIANNKMALEQIAKRAREFGWKPMIASSGIAGDSGKVAYMTSRVLAENYKNYDIVILGGETIPNLPEGHGQGGRNQHYALVTLASLEDYPGDWAVACVASDGNDYMKNIGGAIVDRESLSVSRELGLDINKSIKDCDSYSFLKKLRNSLIKMDDTGTNVGDLVVYYLGDKND